MSSVESLRHIRGKWLNRVARRLARGEGVREGFIQQLDRFFDLLQQAVEFGDPTWPTPLLNEWVRARTESELEKQEASLYPLLNQIFMQTYEVAVEELSPAAALELSGALLPVFNFAFEHTITEETRRHYAYLSEELQKSRRAIERLNRSKSDFISVAAHELRTPLTLIEGYAAMLRDVLPDEMENPQPSLLLKGMDNGTRRLREIVDDMIDVSMIDNNLLSLNYQPVWLNRLLTIIQNELAETVTGRRQILEMARFPGSDEMMYADPERLYQALRNVISNAVKYTPDGGHVRVDGRKLPGFVEVLISDNGIGIDPENHLRIFEKFGQLGDAALHSSGKTKFKGGGPGLGLPIAKGIIEAHGGNIWVESEGYDEIRCPGSTFHVLLPSRLAPPEGQKAITQTRNVY